MSKKTTDMKNILFLLITAVVFTSCIKDSCKEESTYFRYDAVHVTPDEFRVPMAIAGAKTLKNPGKIYFYNDYILINEQREGIHVIDNRNPAAPVNLQFIEIKGNVDMAVSNGLLYADSYTDLVVLDISNIQSVQRRNRVNDVFSSHYHGSENGIISHYERTSVTQTLDCSDNNFGRIWWGVGEDIMLRANFSTDQASNFSSVGVSHGVPAVGIGGSMARFTITHNHLYAIGSSELFSIPIQGGGQMGSVVKTGLQWGIETIFPYQGYLFLGANNGMHIMDLSNPSSPSHVSTFSHANACDPVVVDNDVAFVTLRSGTECQGFVNQLDVIDVSDIHNPKLMYTHSMSNPHGLSVYNNELYLCEGKHGLKAFDKRNLAKMPQNQLAHLKGFDAYDVIVVPGKSLLVIGSDGFRQYDYSNPSDLKLLSTIPVIRT